MNITDNTLAEATVATITAARQTLLTALDAVAAAERHARANEPIDVRQALQPAFMALHDGQALAEAADTLSRMIIRSTRRIL
jgi:hypothetical protein